MDLSVEMSVTVGGDVTRRETPQNKRIGNETSMSREKKKVRANDIFSERYFTIQTPRECSDLISLTKASQETKVVEAKKF